MNTIFSATLIGIDSTLIEVETDISMGLIAFNIVGLPDNAVKEAKVRVMSAIKHSGIYMQQKKITINLAPADIKKDGSSFDLPIAIGVLCGFDVIDSLTARRYLIAGELSLFGDIRPIHGALAMAIKAKEMKFDGIIVPKENMYEAALIEGINVYGVEYLKELVMFLKGELKIEPFKHNIKIAEEDIFEIDFSEVKGQYLAKRGIEIAVAGMHNITMVGSPGSGKSMIAKRIPTVLPLMDFNEMIETTKIYSASGLLKKKIDNLFRRPFRSPHHSISDVGLIGGGSNPKPGEISLAHNGILFLDELPEFKRPTLEALRQPLEDEEVTITRANTSITFPSSAMLVTAMNPCPCGYFGDVNNTCKCSKIEIQRYQKRISGPLLDRIDIIIHVNSVKNEELINEKLGEESKKIKERIINAYNFQKARLNGERFCFNGKLPPKLIKKFCILSTEAKKFLTFAIQRFNISARRYNKILKVARTIADLEQSNTIEINHLSESINYNIQNIL